MKIEEFEEELKKMGYDIIDAKIDWGSAPLITVSPRDFLKLVFQPSLEMHPLLEDFDYPPSLLFFQPSLEMHPRALTSCSSLERSTFNLLSKCILGF